MHKNDLCHNLNHLTSPSPHQTNSDYCIRVLRRRFVFAVHDTGEMNGTWTSMQMGMAQVQNLMNALYHRAQPLLLAMQQEAPYCCCKCVVRKQYDDARC